MPARHEYTAAVQNPRVRFLNDDLANGKTAMRKPGQPVVYSGQFASVYRMTSNGRDHAVRCFVSEAPNRQQRYRAMSDYLNARRPLGFVNFEYLDQELLVGSERHPVVKMEWVTGKTLDKYVETNRANPGLLTKLADQWLILMSDLQSLSVAHNDLQHGNIIVQPMGSIRLVDYDGVFLPSFKGQPSPELGHRDYQHPRRTPQDYDQNIDNFPALVIYLSLTAVARDPALWDRFHTGDNLLFTKNDLANPDSTDLWSALAGIPDPEIHRLTAELARCCQLPVSQTPPLSAILGCRSPIGSPPPQPARPAPLRLKTSPRRQHQSAGGNRGRPSIQRPPSLALAKVVPASANVRVHASQGSPAQNYSRPMAVNSAHNSIQQPSISRSTTRRVRYVASAVVVCVIAVLLWETGALLKTESVADADTRRSVATNPSHAATSPESGSVKDVSAWSTAPATTQEPTRRVIDPDAARPAAMALGDIDSLAKVQFPKHSIDGQHDAVDYFRFSLTEAKEVGLGLRQLDHDADLYLEDARGTVLARSRKADTANEWISRALEPGSYYVRIVARESGENQYVLRYGVKDVSAPSAASATTQDPTRRVIDPDAARAAAVALGDIDSLAKVQFPKHSIDGQHDAVDYFQFSLVEAKEVGLGLRQLDHDADLYLEDARGTVLGRSRKADTANEWISRALEPGSYYVRVVAQEPGENQYVLRYGVKNLSATAQTPDQTKRH